MSKTQISNKSYDILMTQIGSALSEGRKSAAVSVNSILVKTYWNIGKYIVEFEQNGKEHAKYGDELLLRLSRDLTARYVKQCELENWSVRELKRQMRSMLFHRLALSKNKEELQKQLENLLK